ncbi:unnamed protein product [Adineta steineri]|uniref:G-protein coupled receptors family 1 profile domain-containing protein n=1 Tax=Adineta steineri TaxID=433720 RepID=A0A814W650_9BILA|nr:unnamed protein product [Adineta steineri]CAF3586553.1 unnamed protein product [Adineta steineri]
MIICLFGVHINISRLLTFACFLISFHIVYNNQVLGVNAAPDIVKTVYSSFNNTSPLDQVDNSTKRTSSECKAEEIDVTLPYFSLPYRIFAGALVVPITICAIFGNILVIYVIKKFPRLRKDTGNIFLASLAVADVGVSTLAMTFYGLQLVRGRWILGAFMCRLWFSCDVLFSTASIMHLACIALDRYQSIKHPLKRQEVVSPEQRRYIMIAACWIGAGILSFIPIFTGIYTTREQHHKISCLNRVHGRCIFAVNQVYAIVSSSFSFWVPSAVMIVMYVMLIRIADRKEREMFRTADGVARRRASALPPSYQYTCRRSSEEPASTNITPSTQRTHQLSAATIPLNGHINNQRRPGKHDSIDTQMEPNSSGDNPGQIPDPRNKKMERLRRERRAVKTLGAIMVAFLICWLPFFIRYSACEPNRCNWKYMPIIEDIVFWVGYFNSMINPFLYAFHNQDFRDAFQKTLNKHFGCFDQRRTSASSCGPLPPATPTGEGSNTQRASRLRCCKNRSQTNINVEETIQLNNLSDRNHGTEMSNGHITATENSL